MASTTCFYLSHPFFFVRHSVLHPLLWSITSNALLLAGSGTATNTRLCLCCPVRFIPVAAFCTAESKIAIWALSGSPDHHIGVPALFPRSLTSNLEGLHRTVCLTDRSAARLNCPRFLVFVGWLLDHSVVFAWSKAAQLAWEGHTGAFAYY